MPLDLPPSSIVTPEEEVSIAWLLKLFERAFFTAAADGDGDIYITEGLEFPIWIRVLEEERLIRFFTFLQHDPEEHNPITERSANHLNATILLTTFYVNQHEPGRLYADYVLPYTHGVVNAQIVAAARRFAGASLYGAQKLRELVLH